MRIRFNNMTAAGWSIAVVLPMLLVAAWCEDEKVETEVSVHVAKVQKTALRAYVTGYGYVETAPAGAGQSAAGAKIAAPVAGVISKVKCYEGLHVEKNAVLCLLDSRVAEAEVEKATKALAVAEKAFERQKELQKSEATSQKAYQESENQLATARSDFSAAQARLSYHKVSAPFSGTITKLNVRQGESVDSTSVVAEIADFSRLVAAVKLPVEEASALKIGQSAEINTTKNKESIAGKLSLVSPHVDATAGTMTAYAVLPADTLLKPGQFVHVRIVSEERADRLAVPREAVYTDHDGQSTLSIVEENVAKQRVVKAGLRDGNLVEVEGDGVAEGVTVVTLGSYALPKETKIRILDDQKEVK